METVPLQLSEAKVSLGNLPTRTSILSAVLARKVFCIHNAVLSQEERPIAAEQQMHLSLITYLFKEVLPIEILQKENRVVRGTQMLSCTYVCRVYLRGENSVSFASNASDIVKSFFGARECCSISSAIF